MVFRVTSVTGLSDTAAITQASLEVFVQDIVTFAAPTSVLPPLSVQVPLLPWYLSVWLASTVRVSAVSYIIVASITNSPTALVTVTVTGSAPVLSAELGVPVGVV